MGKIKEWMIQEDFERESQKDSLFLLEKEMEMQWEYEEFCKEEAKLQRQGTVSEGKPEKLVNFRKGSVKLPRYVNKHKFRRSISSFTISGGLQPHISIREVSDRDKLPF